MNVFLFAVLLCISSAKARVLISGSSTVYPFATVIGEEFVHKTGHQMPIVESIGTGGGFAAFCAGNGINSPDVVSASRAIKQSEIAQCVANNVTYRETTLGLDAIVLAMHINTNSNDFVQSLTETELFNAFAREVAINGEVVPNPFKKWSDINPQFPNIDIIIYGPPSTSGTRDAFSHTALKEYCKMLPEFKAKYKEKTEEHCSLVRNDGRFIESGENDAFIIHKISLKNGAVGIFGYSYYMENKSKLHPLKINNIMPNNYSISTLKYKIARPLFFYFKNESMKSNIELQKFYKEATSDEAIGFNGYLEDYYLVPLDKKFIVNHKLNNTDSNLIIHND